MSFSFKSLCCNVTFHFFILALLLADDLNGEGELKSNSSDHKKLDFFTYFTQLKFKLQTNKTKEKMFFLSILSNIC